MRQINHEISVTPQQKVISDIIIINNKQKCDWKPKHIHTVLNYSSVQKNERVTDGVSVPIYYY